MFFYNPVRIIHHIEIPTQLIRPKRRILYHDSIGDLVIRKIYFCIHARLQFIVHIVNAYFHLKSTGRIIESRSKIGNLAEVPVRQRIFKYHRNFCKIQRIFIVNCIDYLMITVILNSKNRRQNRVVIYCCQFDRSTLPTHIIAYAIFPFSSLP